MALTKDTIKNVIVSQQKHPNNQRLIERDVFPEGIKNMKSHFIQIISGIRRCGKSTLMQQMRDYNYERNYSINFDDNRLFGFEIDDFEKLHEAFLELFGEENTFYFDEIQTVKGWETYVRRLYEEGKKVIITGSNATMLSKEMGTQLTGRNVRSELFPFSFSEFLKWNEVDTDPLDFHSSTKKVKLKKLFKKYLEKGGFPEYIQTENEQFLKSLYDDIFFRDVVARYQIRKEKLLKELLHYLISNISKEISYNSLRKMLGLGNAVTVKEYISYFEESYLLFTINKFDYSLRKQLINPKKIYVIDTGLANSISFQFSENIGRQLENLVFLELRRKGYEIFFHKGAFECNFVLRVKNKITEVIQVSYSLEDPQTRDREIRGIKEAIKAYQPEKSLILTFEEKEALQTEYGAVKVLPVWEWLLTKIV